MVTNYGYIENFVQDDQLEKWKVMYKKVSTGEQYRGSFTWGIFQNLSNKSTKNHLGFKLFTKEIIPMIQALLPANTKYNFSSFNRMFGPLPIHKDTAPNDDCTPGKSIIFPYSVDGDRTNFKGASTRIYDQDKNLVETLIWKPNMLLWLQGDLYHDSGDFTNFDYKEFFMTQTYLENSKL